MRGSELKEMDKYYTKPNAVRTCLSAINGQWNSFDLVIEPSAGDGAFLREIPHGNKIGIDIDPGAPGIIQADWLSYSPPRGYKKIAVVGNPPFGRSSAMSAAFIRYALSFPRVRMIAFVLPNVYNKHTRQKILPAGWRISKIIPLGKNPFTRDGADFHISSSFFVFEKSQGKDFRFNPDDHREAVDFSWGSRNDFDLFMFGAAPRKLTQAPTANNRGYYLKAKIPIDDLIQKIRAVDWRGNSCASGGVFWLTKSEVVAQYNARYGR